MSKNIFEHVAEHELNMLLDNEMDEVNAASADAHLAHCGMCQKRMDALRELNVQVRQAAPVSDQCCSEGAFWVQLARRLDEKKAQSPAREARPWSRLLPSLGLVALGALLDGLVTMVLVGYTLMNLGALPSLGTQLLAALQSLPASPLLNLLTTLGILDTVTLTSFITDLATFGISANEFLLLTILGVLAFTLAIVIGLLLVWNLQPMLEERRIRGVAAHAVR